MTGTEWPVEGALFVATTIIGGVVLSHMVERPCLRLRERWFPRKTKSNITAAPTEALPPGTTLPVVHPV